MKVVFEENDMLGIDVAGLIPENKREAFKKDGRVFTRIGKVSVSVREKTITLQARFEDMDELRVVAKSLTRSIDNKRESITYTVAKVGDSIWAATTTAVKSFFTKKKEKPARKKRQHKQRK